MALASAELIKGKSMRETQMKPANENLSTFRDDCRRAWSAYKDLFAKAISGAIHLVNFVLVTVFCFLFLATLPVFFLIGRIRAIIKYLVGRRKRS